MSIPALDWAEAKKSVRAPSRFVLVTLAKAAKEKPIAHGDGQAHQCTLSDATLAERTGLSSATVKRAIADLKRLGHIERKDRYTRAGKGGQTSSTTFLNVADESPADFRERIEGDETSGVNGEVKDQPDTRAPPHSSINQEGVKDHCEGGHYIEPGVEQGERARASARGLSLELRNEAEIRGQWQPGEAELADARARYAEKGATRELIAALADRFRDWYEGENRTAKWRQKRWHAWLGEQDWSKAASGKVVAPVPLTPAQIEANEETTRKYLASKWFKTGNWDARDGAEPDKPNARYPEALLRKYHPAEQPAGAARCCA